MDEITKHYINNLNPKLYNKLEIKAFEPIPRSDGRCRDNCMRQRRQSVPFFPQPEGQVPLELSRSGKV